MSFYYNLKKNEKIIANSNVSWNYLVPPIIIGVIGIFLGAYVSIFFSIFVFSIIWLISRYYKRNKNEIIITNKRIIGQGGWISSVQMDSPLLKINSVSVNQGVFGRCLNYGNIKIVTSSTVYKFSGLENPKEFQQILVNIIDDAEEAKFKNQVKIFADNTGSAKFCQSCGEKLDGDEEFCQSCGEKL